MPEQNTLELVDLPGEMREMILNNLDPKSRISYSATCKTCELSPDFIFEDINEVVLDFGSDSFRSRLTYNERMDGEVVPMEYQSREFHGPDYLGEVFQSHRSLFESQSLKLKKLELLTRIPCDIPADEIVEFFRSLSAPLHVESLVIRGRRGLFPILSCVTPGICKEISLQEDEDDNKINELVHMDQWRLAKSLNCCIGTRDIQIGLTYGNIQHFDCFRSINDIVLSLEDITSIKEVLFKRTSFQHWVTHFRYSDGLTEERLKEILPNGDIPVDGQPHMVIFIQISYAENNIYFQKERRY